MKVFGGFTALLVGYSLVTWQAGIWSGDSRYAVMAHSVYPLAVVLTVAYLITLGVRALFLSD